MKQALDVLEILPEHGGNAFTRAADALRQAIAEAEKMEPKPSLWLAIAQDGRVKYTTDSCRASNWKKSGSYRLVRDYYTAPPKRDLTCVCGAVWDGEQMVHAPPKREWVGLTEDEKQFFKAMGFSGIDIVEAKLKEKNT